MWQQKHKDLKNNLVVQGVLYKANENVPEVVDKIDPYLEVKNVGKFTAFR